MLHESRDVLIPEVAEYAAQIDHAQSLGRPDVNENVTEIFSLVF